MQLIRRGNGTAMLFIGQDVLEGPFDAVFEGVLADGAIRLGADRAGEVETGVGMDEEFHRLAKAGADEQGEGLDLVVGFLDVEVPGHGEVTVDMKKAAVFDHTEIVEIDPVVAAAGVEVRDHFLQQL